MKIRMLTSRDIFPMARIVSKIGVREFKACFEGITGSMENVTSVGMAVTFDVAGVILENLSNCETDLYKFFASLTGETVETIQNLPMSEFAQLFVDLVEKEEFKDFFKVASKLFNLKKEEEEEEK